MYLGYLAHLVELTWQTHGSKLIVKEFKDG